MRKLIVFSFMVVAFCMGLPLNAEQPLKVNIFSRNNGVGLQNDRLILRKVLEGLGHEVYHKEFWEPIGEGEQKVDINIFFEHLCSEWFPYARINWFVSNPEQYVQDKNLFSQIDLVLCRTHEVKRLFDEMGVKNQLLGFTSWDCYQENIQKDYSSCIHVAGGSLCKGTTAVTRAWSHNQQLPNLIVLIQGKLPALTQRNVQWITGRIPEAPLRYFQNYCGIHICPSEVEGFGHYIMEAMATKAVVVTTDAPPMNEFIKDKRCLVPYVRTSQFNLATQYFVDSKQLAVAVQGLMNLSEEERRQIGEANRQAYLDRTKAFHDNFEKLLLTVSEKK